MNAGSERSIRLWYGSFPDPWHNPHTARPLRPTLTHFLRAQSDRPAAAAEASGARASTCSVVQSGMATARAAHRAHAGFTADTSKLVMKSEGFVPAGKDSTILRYSGSSQLVIASM